MSPEEKPAPHPPGPWTARDNRIYAADGEEVAVATRASNRWRRSADETARLIASTPNLLAALREVAEHRAPCLRCQETGYEPGDRTSACSRCGGQGATLDATGSLAAVMDAIARAAKRAPGGERDG